jgi:pyruvate dehydrogenase E2 component (dihydrolipoyllysine-residue acetyltransferase)
MPKWGLAMTEGLVTAWHLDEGAVVEKGAPALDIETEKITNEFLLPAGGVLRRRLVNVGDTVPVGALLGILAEPSVTKEMIDAFIESFNRQFAETLASRAEADDTGPQLQTIDVDSRRTRYLVMGESDAAPLALIHGFGGDLNNWLFNQSALAASRQVLALDLPGHGGSSKTLEAHDLAALTRAVMRLLEVLDVPAVHLAGHSLGGAVAMRLALDRPQRVRSVTLVASAGLGPEINMDYVQGFINARRRKDLKPVVQLLFADPALASRELLDDLLKFKRLDGVAELLTRIADTAFAGGAQSSVMRDELSRLEMPVQVIWGSEDRIIPARHAEGLPDAVQVRVLEGAGHMVHMEKAAQVNRLLENFLGSD